MHTISSALSYATTSNSKGCMSHVLKGISAAAQLSFAMLTVSHCEFANSNSSGSYGLTVCVQVPYAIGWVS